MTLKAANLGFRYVLTWFNRLFILFNALYAIGIVYIYTVRLDGEGNDSISLAFGDNAPLFGSQFLETVVGYPTGILLSILFSLALWKIIKQKQFSKKLIYNALFCLVCTALGWTFSISALLAMQTLIQ